MNQEQNLTKFRQILSKLPRWLQIVVVVVIAAVSALVILFSSQGCSTIRVVGNDGNSKVTVQQHALDSMQINVQFNPR